MTTMTNPSRHADSTDQATSWERSESLTAMPSALKRSVVYLVALIVVVTVAVLYFGTAHVVVVRIDDPDGDDRRHWHTACWANRANRRPTRKWS